MQAAFSPEVFVKLFNIAAVCVPCVPVQGGYKTAIALTSDKLYKHRK